MDFSATSVDEDFRVRLVWAICTLVPKVKLDFLNLVFAFANAAVVIYPTKVWIAWLIMCVSALAVLRLCVHHFNGLNSNRAHPRKVQKMVSFVGIVLCALGFIGFVLLYFWTPTSTDAAPEVTAVLPAPDDAIPVRFASISFYQYATVIWTSGPERGYYILPELNPGIWRFKPELRWVSMTPEERRIAFAGRGMFPVGMHDPYGGFATYLISNPAEWFGWLIDVCQIANGIVSYRKFPGGFEIGPFPAGVSTRAGVSYNFYSDGNKVSSSKISDEAAPICSPLSDLSYSAGKVPSIEAHPVPTPPARTSP